MKHRDALSCIDAPHDGKLYIYQDEAPYNPREDDQLGTFVHWHRRYDIGDRKAEEQELVALRRGGFPLLKRYLRATEGAICVLPVGMLDHSGVTIWVGGGRHWADSGGWDSGTVGFIYTTTKRCEELGVGDANVGAINVEEVESQLRAEIEEYNQYLTGDVYGYVLEDMWGQHVDSCWGFFGDDYAVKEGQAAAEAYAEELKKANDFVKLYQEATA